MKHTLKKLTKLSLVLALATSLPSSFTHASTDEIEEVEGPINLIPDDPLTVTCSFLDAKNLGKMALVSRHFKTISEQDILWNERMIPGIKTKKEYVDFITHPTIAYELGNKKSISISAYDLFPIIESGRMTINGYLLAFDKSSYKLRDMLSIIRCMEWSYNGISIKLMSKKADRAFNNRLRGLETTEDDVSTENDLYLNLEYNGIEVFQKVRFDTIEGDFDLINVLVPAPHHEISSGSEEEAEFMMVRLNCLEENYEGMKLSSYNYWGHNRAFEILEDLLYKLYMFKDVNVELKNEVVHFFVQKYVDFRAKNKSPYGEGSYAEPYLRKALKEIRIALDTDFVSTEYVPPVEYVVENEALPEKIREYYSKPKT